MNNKIEKLEELVRGRWYKLTSLISDVRTKTALGTVYVATYEGHDDYVINRFHKFATQQENIYIDEDSLDTWLIEECIKVDSSHLKAGDVFFMKDEKPEVTDFKPSHYTSLPFSVDAVQIETAYNNFLYLKNKGVAEREAFEKSVWLTYALKHLCRIGLKDDSLLEMKKAENYLHMARTGEWLKDD
jgi:hypothetical protein